MRVVAIAAILDHRRMLPNQRATLLGMAREAGLVDGRTDQQPIGIAAVRLVAVGAAHLPLAYRMSRGLHEMRLDIGVAGITRFGLRALVEHRILNRMRVVAVGAGDRVDIMRAAGPLLADVTLMALQAHGVLLRYGGPGF